MPVVVVVQLVELSKWLCACECFVQAQQQQQVVVVVVGRCRCLSTASDVVVDGVVAHDDAAFVKGGDCKLVVVGCCRCCCCYCWCSGSSSLTWCQAETTPAP